MDNLNDRARRQWKRETPTKIVNTVLARIGGIKCLDGRHIEIPTGTMATAIPTYRIRVDRPNEPPVWILLDDLLPYTRPEEDNALGELLEDI